MKDEQKKVSFLWPLATRRLQGVIFFRILWDEGHVCGAIEATYNIISHITIHGDLLQFFFTVEWQHVKTIAKNSGNDKLSEEEK